jgi:hypothetical protein
LAGGTAGVFKWCSALRIAAGVQQLINVPLSILISKSEN